MRRLVQAGVAAIAIAAVTAPGAAAGTPSVEQAEQLGQQAYEYGLPLLELLRVRREQTSVRCPDGQGNSPVNSFANSDGFARPEDRTVVAPNTDTLYSISHLDLGRGPVVLRHPDMGDRYFVFELVDPYTNVIDYIGTRTTGSDAGRFAITWRGARGKVPDGVPKIRSKYRRVWVIGRTLATDEADQEKARKLMARYRLSRPGHGARDFPGGCEPGEPATYPTPTDGPGFLDALARGLERNPPPDRDRPLLSRLAEVGIGPGETPAGSGLPADLVDAVHAGVAAEASGLEGRIRGQALADSIAAGGWLQIVDGIGDYGTDYALRTQIAVIGLGANTAEEALYPTALADSEGGLFNRANRYRLVFGPGAEPPARYFWSLTMYDMSGFLVPNPAQRYSIGPTHPPLVRRADGSIVIAIQADEPSEAEVNWLPAPATGFRLNLRLFGPRGAALDGRWVPPAVVKVP